MAILAYTDLPRFWAGIKIGGSSDITTDMAAESIAEAESEVAAIAEAKGYDWPTILADSTHRLYLLGRSFTGYTAAASLGAAFTRGGRNQQIEWLQGRADQLRERLEKFPDYASGADAPDGVQEPGRHSSGGTVDLTAVQKNSRSYAQSIRDRRAL